MLTQAQIDNFSMSEMIDAMEMLLTAMKNREREERKDDEFCEKLLADFKASGENEYVDLDEIASQLGAKL